VVLLGAGGGTAAEVAVCPFVMTFATVAQYLMNHV
jgi:hypothetical protein